MARTLGASHAGPAPSAPGLDARALPALRQDLRLIEGGAGGHGKEGAGQWRIHDPLAQRFYRVGVKLDPSTGNTAMGRRANFGFTWRLAQ